MFQPITMLTKIEFGWLYGDVKKYDRGHIVITGARPTKNLSYPRPYCVEKPCFVYVYPT